MLEMTSTLKQILLLMGPARRARWALLVLGALLVSLIEAFAALLVALLLSTIVAPDQPLNIPLFDQVGILSDDGSTRSALGALVIGVFLARAGLLVIQAYAQGRVAHNTGAEISSRLLGGYLRMPYEWLLRRDAGELVRNVYASSAEVVAYILLPLIQGISELLVLMGLAIILAVAAPIPAVIAAAFLGVVVATVHRSIRPRLYRYGHEVSASHSVTLQALQQALSGVREIKVLEVEGAVVQQFASQRRAFSRANYMRSTLTEMPRVAIEGSVAIFTAVLLMVAVISTEAPENVLSVAGLFAYAAFRALPSVSRILNAVNNIKFGQAPLQAVYNDLVLVEPTDPRTPAHVLSEPLEKLSLVHVSFRYANGQPPALKDVSVQVMGGEVLGIAGGTGSGKSTLVQIMAGLLVPSSGDIRINSSLVTSPWRWGHILGLVSQEVFLSNDTVRRNIALGVPDELIDEDRIEEAIELAQLRETVHHLPAGLDSVVGDRGMRLSGGQRQRIAVARALFRDPDVLILDEGTSALDVITEVDLIAALKAARKPRTIIHVAHRLTSLRSCSRILVLEAGQLIDEGCFDELAGRNEAFRQAAQRS